MTDKRQLATEWLIEQINTWSAITDEDTIQVLDVVRKMAEQAKQKEIDNLEDAFINGMDNESDKSVYYTQIAQQYINETYNIQ